MALPGTHFGEVKALEEDTSVFRVLFLFKAHLSLGRSQDCLKMVQLLMWFNETSLQKTKGHRNSTTIFWVER